MKGQEERKGKWEEGWSARGKWSGSPVHLALAVLQDSGGGFERGVG